MQENLKTSELSHQLKKLGKKQQSKAKRNKIVGSHKKPEQKSMI